MKLEEQVVELANIGVPLNEGVSIDDLLISYSRDEYESAPFDLILYVYGMEIEAEPWGRFVCGRAWNFDVEAIEDDGSYAEIVKQFHRITGKAKRLESIEDRVNIEEGEAELRYVVEGVAKDLRPVIDNDWADPGIVEEIMTDLCQPGYNYYPIDNGQASVWYYLTHEQALALNNLAGNVLKLNRKPWWKFW